MPHAPTRLIAGVLGLAGFVVACIAGVASQADPADTLWRALAAMGVCTLVGAAIGVAGMVPVRELIEIHRAANPMPAEPPRAGPLADLMDEPPLEAALAEAAPAPRSAQAA